ncbi:MAG: lamin tail domain-containing protein [bacterium]
MQTLMRRGVNRAGILVLLGIGLLCRVTGADAGNLVISEIMYNPVGATNIPTDGDQYEYVEICNTGTTAVSLTGAYLTNGVTFTFPAGRTVGPGAYLVVAKNLSAFAARYPAVTNVLGSYSGKLDNDGDTVELCYSAGASLLSVTFGDGPKWPQAADGHGASLVLVNPSGDHDDPSSWRASDEFLGSPGAAGLPAVRDAVINEVLPHTDPPLEDAIELRNVAAYAISINGWYLSDDPIVRKKYRITNSVIQAGGYAVIYQSRFAATNVPGNIPFSLSELGENVYLTAANAQGNLTRAADFVEFGASSNGMSFGRYPNGTGELVPMAQRTLGGSNGPPRVGPVVISEIMYHTPDETSDAEYLELLNITAISVPLYDPAFPTNTWRLSSGVSFVFPTNVTIPAGGRVVVTGATNLPAFRTMYGLASTTPVFGPWSGRLDNIGERVRLEAPTTPEVDLVPYVLIEDVDYNNNTPWPKAPDGHGPSLERLDPSSYGNNPSNWFAGPPGGSPGRAPLNGFINPAIAPTSPVPGGVFTASVAVVATTLPTQIVFRTVASGIETTYLMHDDGINGDAVTGDLVYSAVASSPASGAWIYYRFEASGTNGQASTLPSESSGLLPAPVLTVRMSGGGLITNVQPSATWTTFTYTNVATHSNLVYVYLNSAGEALVDDLSMQDAGSGIESVVNGDFNSSFAGWSSAGSHSGSFREELQEESGNGVIHIVATGSGGSPSNAVSTILIPQATIGQAVAVSFRTRCAGQVTPQWFWTASGTPQPDVILNEIMYHPADSNDTALEYVELYNPAGVTNFIDGAQLEGTAMTLPAGTVMAPDSYLVLCATQENVRSTYGITNTAGNWDGRLQNDGETLKLVNAYGRELDRVTYADHAPWPVAADGMGPSLERVSAGAPAASTANWASSMASTNWQQVCWTGQINTANSGIRFYLDFEGKVRLDDVSIMAQGSANELVGNGDFEAGTNGWSFLGNHAMTRAVPGTGRYGSTGLVIAGNATRLVVQSGAGYVVFVYGDSASNAVASPPLTVSSGTNYVVSYWVCRDGLAENLYAVVNPVTNALSLASRGTPGAVNSVATSLTPFGISGVSTLFDICPFGTANVVRARLSSTSLVANVRLNYRTVGSNTYQFTDAAYTNVPMRDDGIDPDLVAGDGEYAGTGPVVTSATTIVRYHVQAVGNDGFKTQLPPPDDPSRDFGYLVAGTPSQTILPNWLVFVDGNPVTYPVSKRACAVNPAGEVFTDMRVRHRGYPFALQPETTGIAVRMNKGRFLDTWFADDQEGTDFRHRGNSSQWTQQRVVNEVIAYDLQRQIGLATPRVRHVCLWINGTQTITTELEDPGEAFLRGNDMSLDDYVSRSGYGGRNIVAGDETLDNFVATYNLLTAATGAGKYDCVRTNICYESVMYSMGLLSLTANGDQHFAWNMFQHRAAADGRWRQYPWDADFSFDPNPSGAVYAQTNLHPYYQTTLHPSITPGQGGPLLGEVLFYPEAGAGAEYTLPYRHRHQMLLWRYFNTLYTTNYLYPKLDTLQTTLTPAYVQIRANPVLLSNQVATVKAFIRDRRDFFLNGTWSDKNTNIWAASNVYNPSNVVVNEVMYQPAAGPEYIEFYNPGTQSIDLSWWLLSVGPESYHLPHGTTLGPGTHLVITDNQTSLTNAYPALAAASNLVQRYPGYGVWDWPVTWTSATEYATRIVQVPALSLPNTASTITLTDLQGNTIDRVAYSNTPPWPAASGVSIELGSPAFDNEYAANWHLCSGTGTPGVTNSSASPEVTPIGDHATMAESPYTIIPVLTRGAQPVTWSFRGSTPAGMTINTTNGRVDWPGPTPAGQNYSITIRATNNFGYCDEQWNLLVNAIGQVATPQFSPDEGTYPDEFTVTVTCATPGTTIRYTTNNVDPATGDPALTSGGTVRIQGATVLKARAWKTNWTESQVKSAGYMIREPRVSILSPTDGAVLRTTRVSVGVRASDTDGLDEVRLYNGTNLLWATNIPGATFVWSNTFLWVGAPTGTNTLKAMAFDALDNSSTSTPVAFVVRPMGSGADFDGDGRNDIAVFHPAGGTWYLRHSSIAPASVSWGWSATLPVPGDYDGDGKTDTAVYWPQGGTWYLRYSGGGSANVNWGWNATVPVPGDYDGDGRTDIAVYWPQGGTWYLRYSSGGSATVNWGWSATVPVPGDYDGDGRTDIAVYWPQGGTWYLRYSGGGSANVNWGWSAAVPVPGDYDGDGKTDVAVYHPGGGMWYLRNSGGSPVTVGWGWSAVLPVPADYDGDGRTDVAVYWPQGGTWYLRYSGGGSASFGWGWSAALPVLPQYMINRWMLLLP